MESFGYVSEIYWGGGWGHLWRNTFEILSCGEIVFAQNLGFLRNFRDVSTHNTPKITFYCIFINKFPKNFEKSAQKFFAAPSAPKVWKNTPIFSARLWKIHPPPLRGHPPKKTSLICICPWRPGKKLFPGAKDIYVCPYFLSTVNYLVSYIRMVMYTILAIANVYHKFPC